MSGFNAVLNAELKVVERSPHSMVVAYVPVSRDAAISGDYKDFKFKNNTDYPIYIMGSASGGILSFRVYGHETREPGREISFESEITDTIEPGEEVVTEDPDLPASYRSVTQSAHVGYKAKLWKIIKVNGVQTDKVQVNTSAYNASPQYVTVGKRPATPAPGSASPAASSSPSDKSKKKDTSSASPKSATGSQSSGSKSSGSNTKKNTSGTSGNSTGKNTTNTTTNKNTTENTNKKNTAKTLESTGGKAVAR